MAADRFLLESASELREFLLTFDPRGTEDEFPAEELSSRSRGSPANGVGCPNPWPCP